MKNILLIFMLLLTFLSCKKDKEVITTPIDQFGTYNPNYILPRVLTYLPPMENPDFNKMTEEGVRLGKSLYYDKILSTNGLSCSSCHLRAQSFTISAMGPVGTAVLPHVNVGWQKAFGWNGGEEHLDNVALADLAEGNPFLEANNDSILNRLKRNKNYQILFWKAFGVKITELSTPERQKYISYSLAQFIRTMISGDSKFDKFVRGETALTPSEMNGYNIYMDDNRGDCYHCHGSAGNPLWTDREYHNNALNSSFSGVDQGRYLVTGDPADMGKFRSPTLRNIALTAPYMHDNRYATLEDVIDFYSTGLQQSATVDPLMNHIAQGGAQLSTSDKADLIAFLHTLTDSTFINNTAFY
ncbi:MAG: cytochrome-c peroxidase [Flavobacteriales bacterium CG18_big_fil_WC_8_21_14_2_50_32_9]|nr:c-type cytochrome [Flavobacteriales bacterium]PIQ15314.1 MAG: cytochrome-c peroxidase [Flavobacteriales bacterium CG18_big_fil_WC_8_21_14_2_50_32_9]PJC63162.1 MAG: cytochrome-c peroxidase [Flavobacteriales bacterium CG_4_9_14_0_2_um_filter_32_27]